MFLIATLAVYVLLPELREIQDKAMMAVVTSLAVSYIILSIQNLRPQEDGDYAICISLGTKCQTAFYINFPHLAFSSHLDYYFIRLARIPPVLQFRIRVLLAQHRVLQYMENRLVSSQSANSSKLPIHPLRPVSTPHVSLYRFKNFPVRDKPLFVIYCLCGWGGPVCFLIVVLITHHIGGRHLRPGFGEQSCWFKGEIDIG